MIRKLISKFNKSITKRVVSARHNYEVPIRVWIEPDRNTGRLQKAVEHLSVAGETKDMSKTGIAFVVPVIRLREYYLVGESRTLNAELDLPSGTIQMQIIGQRYEQVGQHISEAKFLIGATIFRLSPQQREAYEEFLQFGKKRNKAKGLALGIESDS